MCFLTWGVSADACSSRAQVPPPARQRDQRTAAGRVRPAHIASVSARSRKRSATPLARPSLVFTHVCRHAHMHIHMHDAYAQARIYMSALVCAYMYYVYVYDYMYICICICIFDMLLIVCGCLCMHKHMRAQQSQKHVFFVMCFLTWGASADACSSRAQGPLSVRQRDQRTAVGRV